MGDISIIKLEKIFDLYRIIAFLVVVYEIRITYTYLSQPHIFLYCNGLKDEKYYSIFFELLPIVCNVRTYLSVYNISNILT